MKNNERDFNWKMLLFVFLKALGGMAAVIGISGAILISTWKTGFPVYPFILSGLGGIVLFQTAGKKITEGCRTAPEPPTAKPHLYQSVLPWILFLLFVAIIILLCFMLSK